eukprot:gene6330-180_t
MLWVLVPHQPEKSACPSSVAACFPVFVDGWLQLNGGLHASAAGSPPVIGHW